MVDTTIRSKLSMPIRPVGLVPRPRLLEQLDQGLEGNVTLIVAPAGYGKTTVTLEWLARRDRKLAWIELDEADRDLERFALYLTTALHGLSRGGFERSRAILSSRSSLPWAHFCDVLVAEMQDIDEPAILVLEDYHSIDTSAIHELVELMVERAPSALHVVAVSRTDPPWPSMRWRIEGRLSELRARDLRFSPREVEALFAGASGLTLAPATVERLHRRTEGWIAGLHLVRLSLSASDDAERRAAAITGADRHIADYLMQEVMAGLSDEMREFFAVSALLARFSAPLLDHLFAARGPSHARELLAEAARDNLFLVNLDDRRGWYRWHHLFREPVARPAARRPVARLSTPNRS